MPKQQQQQQTRDVELDKLVRQSPLHHPRTPSPSSPSSALELPNVPSYHRLPPIALPRQLSGLSNPAFHIEDDLSSAQRAGELKPCSSLFCHEALQQTLDIWFSNVCMHSMCLKPMLVTDSSSCVLLEGSRLSLHPAVNVEDVDSVGEMAKRSNNMPRVISQQGPNLKTLTVPGAPKANRTR